MDDRGNLLSSATPNSSSKPGETSTITARSSFSYRSKKARAQLNLVHTTTVAAAEVAASGARWNGSCSERDGNWRRVDQLRSWLCVRTVFGNGEQAELGLRSSWVPRSTTTDLATRHCLIVNLLGLPTTGTSSPPPCSRYLDNQKESIWEMDGSNACRGGRPEHRGAPSSLHAGSPYGTDSRSDDERVRSRRRGSHG
ncbi:hypothetical protein M407DRAFT_30903 [Tulasnella calospora MUT 4182]|uniref:Uncharacterized protein n=1 Tax=Tulasnella calospora MUT 4182 TaxID=1051891 RepID=A0A0C3PWM6_9AGAM|nr:hypothetical protein M407DRAFT_30903 [Tulasnella calospora MUT 4182]